MKTMKGCEKQEEANKGKRKNYAKRLHWTFDVLWMGRLDLYEEEYSYSREI